MFENFEMRLRDSLKNAGYSITRATEELGLSKNAITNYMRGRIPTGEILYKLSQLCGVSMEFLLTGKEIINLADLSVEEQKILEMYNQLTEKNKGKTEMFIEQKIEEQHTEFKSKDSQSYTSLKSS